MTRYALVVGISEYNADELPNLSKTVADAEAIAKLLDDYGDYRVTTLIGKVTVHELAEALKTFLTKKAVNKEAIIYFTGHGIQGIIPNNDPLATPKTQGFFTTSNCNLTKKGDDWLIKGGAISFESINNLISENNFSNLMMIIDACHSGSLIEEIQQKFSSFNEHTDYYMMASSQSYELSWAKSKANHSVFTGALLKALGKDQADEDGVITAGKAFDTVYRELERNNERQEPIFLGKGRALKLLTYPITPGLMGYSPPSSQNQQVKNEPRQAYLMVTVEQQGEEFLFKGYLGFKDDPESVTPLEITEQKQEVNLETTEQKQEVNGILDKISKYIRQYLTECENDEQLKGKYHNLCVEIFLPFDYLTKSVEHCKIKDDLGDLRELCRDKQVIIRCYERHYNNNFWNLLYKGWQRCPKANSKVEDIVTKILHLDQKETLNCNNLEIQLNKKSILTCTLTKTEKDLEILKAVIRSGIPLTFWSRSSEFSNKGKFEEKFNNCWQQECTYNIFELVNEIHKTRKESWQNCCDDQAPITEWGYYLGVWLDNPNRPPFSSLQPL